MRAGSLKPEYVRIARAGLKRPGTSTSKLWLLWDPIAVLLAHSNIIVLCQSNCFTLQSDLLGEGSELSDERRESHRRCTWFVSVTVTSSPTALTMLKG